MPRPLTGSRWQRGNRFYASVPAARGATRRVEESFELEDQRDAWADAAVAAVKAGRPVPAADQFRVVPSRKAVAAQVESSPALEARPLFEELAHGWLDEYYAQLRNGDAERERDVRILVKVFDPVVRRACPLGRGGCEKAAGGLRPLARRRAGVGHACG